MGRGEGRLFLAALLIGISATASLAVEWRLYQDPEFGYSVSVPSNGFDVERGAADSGLTLYEQDGGGQIDVYAVKDDDGLSLAELRRALSDAERIKKITYSRAGASWFVVSGYYNRRNDESGDLIFYAKFMISRDRKSVSAFEASYPQSEKRRYDPIIEHMEDTLTPPQVK